MLQRSRLLNAILFFALSLCATSCSRKTLVSGERKSSASGEHPTPVAQETGLKAGFRDLKWGDPLPAEGMTFQRAQDDVLYYTRRTDKLIIGDAKLHVIYWGFYTTQFHSAATETESGYADALLQALQENWGKGSESSPLTKGRFWETDDTIAVFSIEKEKDVGRVLIVSRKLKEQRERDQKERAAKAKEDL